MLHMKAASLAVQVRSPKVAPFSRQSNALELTWDCYGTVYGKLADALANGQDGTVRQVASRTSFGGEQLV